MSDEFCNHWSLSNNTPINHASFGATPDVILDIRDEYQRQFDKDREGFLNDVYFNLLDNTRKKISSFVNTNPDDLVVTGNVTEGFNAVFRSLPLGADDEILITDQIYSNFPTVLRELSKTQGFKIKTVSIPFPIHHENEVIEAMVNAASDKTKIAFFDHITSASAVILPVKRLVQEFKDIGVESFVDGAQAVGQVNVNIDEIGAAYYAGNHHKWMCAPVASGFLHVRADKQDDILPAVLSGESTCDNSFQDRFKWLGTRDPSSCLCVAQTIDFIRDIAPESKGWDWVFEHNHDKAVQARNIITQELGVEKLCPDDMIGSMFSVSLGKIRFPNRIAEQPPHRRLANLLKEEHGFEVYGLVQEDNNVMMRVSVHLYNDQNQYARLAQAMRDIIYRFGMSNNIS